MVPARQQLRITGITKNSFRSSKAKMIGKPEFTGVNEDFEIIFNSTGAENMNHAKVSG